MINFYPGPSKIHPEYKKVVHDLLSNGLATYNHRSPEFMDGYKNTVAVLKQKLEVPATHELFFLSSATECWESICQTFSDLQTKFLYNGAFGKKWAEVGKTLMKNTRAIEFDENEGIDKALNQVTNCEMIAYVHNETSNGTVVRKPYQKLIKDRFPDAFVAVDATSSLGGAQIDYTSCDIVFASVQKCMGAPAGLAVMVISPKVKEWLEKIEFTKHYNDLNEIYLHHKKNQTTHTPNVLGILALGKMYEELQDLNKYIEKVYTRAENFEHFIENNPTYDFLTDKSLRSKTVFCIRHNNVEKIIREAKLHNIILGKGYGKNADSTFRVANFPAHSDADFEELKQFLYACK